MPLKKSTSDSAIGPNVKAEEKAGKPYNQALAIALSTQDQAKKKHKHAADVAALFPPASRTDSEGWEPVSF